MTGLEIVGLISALFTFEESIWSKIPIISRFCKKRKINLNNWNSEDPVTQARLESFKSKTYAQYKEHLFTEDEIDSVIKDFYEENKDVAIKESERQQLEFIIRDIFNKYNVFTQSQMTIGEKVLLDKQNEMDEKLNQLLSQKDKENERKFLKAIENSKVIGLNNIDGRIKGEYEIDRGALIEKIKNDSNRFICVSGNAGVGKSALCKKLLRDEKYVLYARAERISSSRNIDEIWDCEIEACIKDIKTERIYFFVDALEYIADVQSITAKIELLQCLLEVAKKQENVFVVTTCRSSDISSFAKLFANYEVQSYKIEELSREEIEGICSKYPLIKELSKSDKYSALLKNPLYISLILSNFNSISDVNNECDLRNKIWNDIICLGNKARDRGLSLSKIRETIEKIVFDRAKEFRLGVNKNDLDEEILKKLESECIVAVNGDLVRLKHDLFEDICFEIKFDRLFDECNGEYATFFNAIKDFGRCAYRRYQIWISNKIFAKDSREKFLYQLVFNQENDEKWRNQTIIGIVKSEYCQDFFYDYYTKLLNSGLLLEFIRIINLYAFDAKPFVSASGYHFLQLIPTGKARESIIRLICENQSYDVDKESVIKLCDDYSQSEKRNLEISKATCKILEFYVTEKRKDKSEYWGLDIPRAIKPLLRAIYRMADASKEWVAAFLNEQVVHLKSDNCEDRDFSEKILEWTIKECELALIKELPDVMCHLAKKMWLSFDYKPEEDFHALEREKMFGLSHFASDRNFSSGMHDKQPITEKNRFFSLFLVQDFWKALDWAIGFVNDSISYFATVKCDEIKEINLRFVDSNVVRTYYGNPKLWFCASHEYEIPLLLSDIIYWLKNSIINILTFLKSRKDNSFLTVADTIRLKMYKQSNNIALLSILNYIGLHFLKELPGYAVDLATNMDLIWWDINRTLLYRESGTMKILKEQIAKTILGGAPLQSRYELDSKCSISLQDYIKRLQLANDEELKQKSYLIIDYLYSITKNEGEESKTHLLIQQMDLRNANVEKINEVQVVLTPRIEGDAKKNVEEQIKEDAPLEHFYRMFSECKQTKDYLNFDLINKTIDYALEQSNENESFRIETEKDVLDLIIVALSDNNITQERKGYLCQFWIDGINKLLDNKAFVTDNKNIMILWAQLKMGVPMNQKNALKKLMLDILMYPNSNGMIRDLSKTVKIFLRGEKCHDISRAFFNTILMLAKNEKDCQKYRTQYLERQSYVYIISKEKLQDFILRTFKSQKHGIIQRYLYEGKSPKITNFNLDDYEISVLCFISNCGFDFKDAFFTNIIKETLKYMIRIWGELPNHNAARDLLDYHLTEEIEELLRREIVEKDTDDVTAINLMFDGIQFPVLHQEVEKFYLDILGYLQLAYFDNSKNQSKRKEIERKINYLEQKILIISAKSLKESLYKALCFCVRSCYVPNPRQFETEYGYDDKMFINEQLKKYGVYDVEEMFRGLFNMNAEKLLPEILDSINVCVNEPYNKKSLAYKLENVMDIVNMIVTSAFVDYSDNIKKDILLRTSYEGILEALVSIGNEKAAWLLDEFRLH